MTKKIAIITDIHANLEALTAVLKAIEPFRPDNIICLGDIVGYASSVNECCELIKKTCVAVLLGNHDAAIAGFYDYSAYAGPVRKVWDLHKKWISEENFEWLKSLKPAQMFQEIELSHGSPLHPEAYEYLFSPDDIIPMLKNFELRPFITFVGHSHLNKSFVLEHNCVQEQSGYGFELLENKKYIFSVGSVGQPRDFDNRSSFAIYDMSEETVVFYRVSYDIISTQKKILSTETPAIFAQRLAVGF